MAKLTEKAVKTSLLEVFDPEMNISIMDLGLVYDVKVKPDKKVLIKMTLTTLGCPLFPMIERDIKNKVSSLGAKEVKTELTFEPPWSFEKMSDRAKATLGL